MDLVEWQFRVAAGEPLPMSQKEIPLIGHAIEVIFFISKTISKSKIFKARIYAEDSRSNFMPTAGFLEYLKFPSNARVDSGIREGDEVTVFYDPMIAKIISTGKTREEAIFKLEKALSQTHIGGLYNNVEFVRCCLKHEKFLSGDLYTDFIRDHQNELLPTEENYSKNPNILMESAIAFLLLDVRFYFLIFSEQIVFPELICFFRQFLIKSIIQCLQIPFFCCLTFVLIKNQRKQFN